MVLTVDFFTVYYDHRSSNSKQFIYDYLMKYQIDQWSEGILTCQQEGINYHLS